MSPLLSAASFVSASSLPPKKSFHRSKTRAIPDHSISKQPRFISCEKKQSGGQHGHENHIIDRRNMLLGIGGLYGATATVGSQGKVAFGAPVEPPNLSKCQQARDSISNELGNCCPPYDMAKIVDFEPPSQHEPLRRRKPAQKLSHEELEKFKTAIAKMKALDKNDPWNYMQQAAIHCAYCNGAYNQVDFPESLLLVHESWLFLPWHRYYIYFWERILGKLIGDPTFAIPYWNWDNPEGMRMPEIYLDNSSPLYNDKRNHNHYKALLDYNYSLGDPIPTQAQEADVAFKNLKCLYNMYTEALKQPSLFMGDPVRAGEKPPKAGCLELLHNNIHTWAGPDEKPNHDIGNLYTAARDTMFFGLHANVDRLWDLYGTLRGHKPEFKDPDWLDASFIFYDENRQVVKVKVKDCLNAENLGYSYKTEPHYWKDIRRRNKVVMKAKKRALGREDSLTLVSEFGTQPRSLDAPLRVLVPRPKTSRTKEEKEDELEVLVIDDIVIDHAQHSKFDVYIAKPVDQGLVGPDYGELAGSFVRLPHLHSKQHHHTGKRSKLDLGITNLLDDIDAESSDKLVVTLVPKHGNLSIGGVYIKLDEADM